MFRPLVYVRTVDVDSHQPGHEAVCRSFPSRVVDDLSGVRREFGIQLCFESPDLGRCRLLYPGARKEDKTSRWQFYPGLIGLVLLGTFLASIFTNIKIPKLLERVLSREESAPAEGHAGRRAPEVSGIMFAGNEPKALVDGYVLKKGEEIEGFVLDEIKENSVTFLGPDGTRTVRRVK